MKQIFSNHSRIAAFFLTALLIRVLYALLFPVESVKGDAFEYDTIAVNLISGGGFSMDPGVPTPIRAPGYPVFLAAVYLIFKHSYLIAVMVQALAGAFTCLIVWDLSRRLFDEKISLLSGWFCALYPVFISYSGLLLSETLFTLLFAASLNLLVRFITCRRLLWLALSGATLGFTTLTRATTILFPLAVFLALMVVDWRQAFKQTCLFLAVFFLVIAPWMVRNYRSFGVFMPVATGGSTCLFATGRMAEGSSYEQGMSEIPGKWEEFKNSRNFSRGKNPHVEFDRELKKEGINKIKKNFPGYIVVVLKRIPKYWISSHSSVFGVDKSLGEYYSRKDYFPIFFRIGLLFFHGVVFVFMVLGMVYAGGSFKKWAILLLVFFYFNMHILFDLCPRFFVPIFPYIFIFSAVTALKFHNRLRSR
ncbi:MAG: glycosyltransferase family 39 protein [Elusimicrobia bacterium]|nr:glycosyltransferase family 39 protein [Elusimicrobiota bacterium]